MRTFPSSPARILVVTLAKLKFNMSILQTADYKCTSKKAQFSYDIFFCETLGQLPSPAFGACGDIFMCGNFQGSPSELSVFIHSGDGTWTEWSKQADFHHPIHSDVILAVSDKSRKDIPKDAKYWVWRGKQNSIMHYKRSAFVYGFFDNLLT